MPLTQEFDTIAAISTPPGEGAISIVRLSGSKSFDLVSQLFDGKNFIHAASHTIHYGHLFDEKGQMLDEVMISIMRGPKTFTREDIIEINAHGGLAITQEILQTLLRAGARLAEPGEFTKRAFLNGRIDLTQAESVMDLIRARTDQAAHNALKQLSGSLSDLIQDIRQEILETLAQVEVNIDYPEYDDVETLTSKMLLEKTDDFENLLKNLLSTAKRGKILREGLKTAIIGRPNVGKSSLLNQLLQTEKAIVTDVAGTTRDTVEEYAAIAGIPLHLIDTAGIHETDDLVEKIGIERSLEALDEADLVLLVLDTSSNLTEEDSRLLHASDSKSRILVLNKSDLPQVLDEKQLGDHPFIKLSALKSQNMDTLETAIEKFFFTEAGKNALQGEVGYLSNIRHIQLVEEALRAVQEAKSSLNAGLPVDLVQVDVTRAWQLLGQIVGDGTPDELITQLFSQFCLGK